ncbi:putative RNA methyltransferase [Sporosarcina sp. G11-34]|uniref:putative RNA methyltransferase n=1 Tax=Sporosarcina sp. G11-34 TaxID=2849605 RepID=UPI0022A9A754|nr:methyltransferase domain-containing protein [Sporosarcina sp. G11-34]MCZ2259323.1 methyltransferase domain-containing protein [Sporosarcina sp. G11-34]
MTLSKKMINALALEQHAQLFRCPICSSQMALVEYSRLVCTKNHSFDLSKNGYVNLAPQAHVTKYDKSLFEARKIVIDGGFFNPLLDYITESLAFHFKGNEELALLDAGCGEGSHLSEILQQLPVDVIGIGIDLAKEGIATAAKEHPGNIWCVADLANCPFEDGAFDTILNILSPANYAEFTRLLKPDGLFIKVVPEKGYLKELRAIFYNDDTERQQDSEHVNRFAEQFELMKTERITYEFQLDCDLLAPLIQMTPLSWGADQELVKAASSMDIPVITIDFTVMIGKRKTETIHESN